MLLAALKFFAVCFGLRLAFGQYAYVGSMPFARSNSSQTYAKNFLMRLRTKTLKFGAEWFYQSFEARLVTRKKLLTLR